MGRRQIPDGWFDYHPMKDALYDARIIPIKCPLPISRFQDPSLSRYQWTAADVMYRIPNLGLIIDITYKHPPYYDTYEFTSNGVEYVKIPCRGHHVPSEEVYSKFCDVVNNFVMRNGMNNRIIALHCTHGVNRTGYLLCRYLVERLFYSPDDAIHAFASQRGYPIERENYRQAICSIAPAQRF